MPRARVSSPADLPYLRVSAAALASLTRVKVPGRITEVS